MSHGDGSRLPGLACVLVLLALPRFSVASDQIYPRPLIVEDAYQLRDTIEETHPDPYLAGGGKIAFHRRFHEVLRRIPETGMTRADFLGLLQPFVAAIGDSHTAVVNTPGEATPLSLPLGFKILDEGLVVDRVATKEQIPLLGARLVAIEGVSLAELIDRQGRLRGFENRFGMMAVMNLRTLTTRQGLLQLVPEWKGKETIRVDLLTAGDEEILLELGLLDGTPDTWVTPPSRVSVPSMAASDVAYTFLEPERATALLVISDLMRYREACELWLADGLEQADVMTRAAYEHFHGVPGPENRDELLAGIPPATPTIAELVKKMKAAGTRNLIVDLRGNTGGNSVMREILVYLLFGRRGMESMDNGYQIVKLSRLLFDQYSSTTLEHINEGRSYPLRATDYEFDEEDAYLAADEPPDSAVVGASSFREVFDTGEFHQPQWTGEKILVLSSPTTFSSGFNVLTGLYALGATVVGTPSAQPANNFGDMLVYQLKNTEIQAAVSHKQNITFPDDPELGRCLRPTYPLTYEKLKAYDFDPNSEILLALDVLGLPK